MEMSRASSAHDAWVHNYTEIHNFYNLYKATTRAERTLGGYTTLAAPEGYQTCTMLYKVFRKTC